MAKISCDLIQDLLPLYCGRESDQMQYLCEWVIYSFLICDLSTAVSDTIVLLVDAVAIIRLFQRQWMERKAVSTVDDST